MNLMKRNSSNFSQALKLRILVLAIFHFAIATSCSQDRSIITYIGNMGILVGNENNAVLIDGFHKEYRPQYVFPPEKLVKKIIQGTYKNYGNIDIALATHFHRDHFDPDYFYDFLEGNSSSLVILSPQIKKMISNLNRGNTLNLQSRISNSKYDDKADVFEHANISVIGFKCDHINPSKHGSVENTAYMIKVNGITLLHVGDSNWDVAENHLMRHKKIVKNVDVAVLPYWMLLGENSKSLVERLINPKNLIATHLPPGLAANQAKKISVNFPKVVLFTEIGQEIEIFGSP